MRKFMERVQKSKVVKSMMNVAVAMVAVVSVAQLDACMVWVLGQDELPNELVEQE